MKKWIMLVSFSIIITTVILLFSFPIAAEEYNGYNYTVSNKQVRIYSISRNLSGDIVIPEKIAGYPVTQIGSYAFSLCKNLTSIRLPSTLVCIEDYAFYECSSLTSITIPDSVTTMGECVFQKCAALKSFKLSNKMTEIPSNTFSGCSSLETVIIPQNIRSIERSAFFGCSSIKEIYIPKSVTTISRNAFGNCTSLEKITIPFIGESLSGDSNREFYDIFGSSNKYDVPQSLKEVVILGGNDIPENTFEDCEYIEKIHIPESVTNIGEKAFYKCPSLKEIVVDKNNKSYHVSENCLIDKTAKRLILALPECKIPSDGSIKSIGSYAFTNRSEINKIIVPNSVQTIEFAALSGCSSLKELSIPFVGEKANGTSHTNFGYIFGAYSDISHNSLHIPPSLKTVTVTGDCSIAEHAFMYCRDIVSFTATSSIKDLGSSAFWNCFGLRTIRFEGGLETIGQGAFSECSALKEILLPENVKKIAKGVFESNLKIKILCAEGTLAHQYAIDNKIPYEITEMPSKEETTPPPYIDTAPLTNLETTPVEEPVNKGCKSSIKPNTTAITAFVASCFVIFRKKRKMMV